jgi:hypothetical protein
MGTQLKKKRDKLLEKMKKHDEELLELLKQGHKEIIARIIKDYLSSCE